MAEILIERCTLRVVRRQGWSWGPAPQRLLEQALQFLPDLLAARLESLFPDDEERVYEAPLRISLKFRLASIDEEFSSASPKSFASSSSGSAPFDVQLESALCAAFDIPHTVPVESIPLVPAKPPRFTPTIGQPLKASFREDSLQHFLLALLKNGELGRFLASFTLQELEVWHAALYRMTPQSAAIEEPRVAAILGEIEAARSARTVSPNADRATRLRFRLVLVAETATKLRLSLTDPVLWLALDRDLPLPESANSRSDALISPNNESNAAIAAPPTFPDASSSLARAAPAAPSQIRVTASSDDPDEWTTQVHSALPFLLLGPLHRIGYFSTLSAVLEVARLSESAHLFAAAFAYKVLDPPERGWRRSEPAQHTAAVLAGAPRPPSDEALHEFARSIATHTGPLDRWLADTVNSGRDKTHPVLLRRAESDQMSGFLLFDPPGCFLFACVEDASAAVTLVQSLGSPVVLVSSEASGPRILQELDHGQLTFITQVPPVRGETWRQITQGTSRLGWTNHPHPASEFLVHAARALDLSSLEAASLWEQLGSARPAVPRANLPALERSVTLAAGVALGILAWQLWKERGRTTPQLALERLGDLDATVRFSGETLQVGLPRGRRHSELLDAGFLAPVPNLPWLGGRRLEFGWG